MRLSSLISLLECESNGSNAYRLLPHLTRTHILTSKTGLQSIDLIEKILFPLDGYPGPTPPDPSPEEAEELRRKVDMRLREVIPCQSNDRR